MKNKYSQIVFTATFLLIGGVLMAQDAGEAVQSERATALAWVLNNMVFIISGLVVIGAFAALFYLNSMLLQTQKIRLLQEHGIEVMEEVKLLDKEPAWMRLTGKIWGLAPMEKEKEILFDHEYDGIRELDNVLPPWWVALFYVTIIFGVGYYGYYHMGGSGVGSAEEYEIAMEDAEKSVKAYLAKQADAVDETNVVLLTDDSDLSIGQTIFQTTCVACHGMAGEGNAVGPNLTDEYWLNGGGIKNVFTTIKYGVPEKGMISWKSQIRAADMQRVASYILSLQGTNPPNAKEPQGEKWEESTADEEM